MPISVVCPGCKAKFDVSDKFAGKQGPCPKCKALITVPVPGPEVKIHAPTEFATAGKDQKGRAIAKPIPRPKSKLNKRTVAAIAGGAVLIVAATWIVGRVVGKDKIQNSYLVQTVGVALVSLPLVMAAYAVLRDDELEPYRGRALWLRSLICAAVYALLWGAFYFVPKAYMPEYWSWGYIAPPFIVLGTLTAMACLDLDPTNAFFHYAFYLGVTILLRSTVGMEHIWNLTKGTTQP